MLYGDRTLRTDICAIKGHFAAGTRCCWVSLKVSVSVMFDWPFVCEGFARAAWISGTRWLI